MALVLALILAALAGACAYHAIRGSLKRFEQRIQEPRETVTPEELRRIKFEMECG